jgi:hypothetical protein
VGQSSTDGTTDHKPDRDFNVIIGNDFQVHINGGRDERVEKVRDLTVVGQSVQILPLTMRR